LEAELGVATNSSAEPDFRGWEVKPYAVEDFDGFEPAKPITLTTPEPSGGVYKVHDTEAFIRKFGYPTRVKDD
jgi:hypothetical protein